MRRPLSLTLLVVLALGFGLSAQGPLDPVLMLKPPTEVWASYHGDYTGRHFSPLTQVDTSNAKNLSLAWFYRMPGEHRRCHHRRSPSAHPIRPAAGTRRRRRGGPIIKAMPLMVNGILYLSVPNRVFAVDARTGRQTVAVRVARPQRDRQPRRRHVSATGSSSSRPTTTSSRSNRRQARSAGLASSRRRRVELVHVGADRRAQSRPRRHRRRHARAGSTRGFVESLDAETGASQWKLVHDAGAWRAGDRDVAQSRGVAARAPARRGSRLTYDPDLNLALRHNRPGNAHLQRQEPRGRQSLHLFHRRARTSTPGRWSGTTRLAARHARLGRDRSGDPDRRHRSTGSRASCWRRRIATATSSRSIAPTASQSSSSRSRSRTPTSRRRMACSCRTRPRKGSPGGTLVFPTSDGAVNFPAQSFSPDTGLFYVNATDAGSIFYMSPDPTDPTGLGRGAGMARRLLRIARDGARLPHRRCEVAAPVHAARLGIEPAAGLLSTGRGTAVLRRSVRQLHRVRRRDGKILWHAQLGSQLTNSPQTYRLDGRQYITSPQRIRCLRSIFNKGSTGLPLRGDRACGYDIRQGTIANSVRAAGWGRPRAFVLLLGCAGTKCLACKSNGRWMNVSATPWQYTIWVALRFLTVPSPPFSPYLSPVATSKTGAFSPRRFRPHPLRHQFFPTLTSKNG